MGGGHPPPAAFVPFVLLGGIAGHILLVLVQWLLRKGRARLAGHPGEAPAWPAELVLIALVLGPLAIMMIAVAVDQFPRQGSRFPWRLYQNYILDFLQLRLTPVRDDVLQFR